MSTAEKANLLAAIASSVNAAKTQSKQDTLKNIKSLQQDGLNSRNAYDLVSNASRVAGDVANIKDVAPKGNDTYEHRNTILDQGKLSHLQGSPDRKQQDARSVKSEFDYNSKKKFTDVLGDPSKAQQLTRLKNEF